MDGSFPFLGFRTLGMLVLCITGLSWPVLHELVTKLKECDIDFWQLNETNKIQLILDSTTIGKTRKITSASAQLAEL
jgi:hypothetical protein